MNKLTAWCALIAVSLVSLGGAACTRILDAPEEVLESFAVSLDFDPAVLDYCRTATPDLCYDTPGTAAQPHPYAHEQYASFFLLIEAIGSKGTRPFPWDGDVGVFLPRGQLHPQLDRIQLTGGVKRGVQVRLRRVPGSTTILVEDRLEGRNATAPTFAVGSSEKLYFEHPKIAQIQETLDESTSSLYKSYVEVSDGVMFVTRVSANGFNVQDVSDTDWNALFVYAYNGVEGLTVGSQLLYLAGGITEFIGTTQMDSPQYAAPHVRCEVALGASEGFEDTEVDEGGLAVVARCPEGTTCTQVEEAREGGTVRLHRCEPDSTPERWDAWGRLKCSGDGDPVCPAGTACTMHPAEQARFCQVVPVAPPADAWPRTYGGFPYCGPMNSGRELPLIEEMHEGKLVTLTSSDGELRVEGLPICRYVDDVNSVASACNPSTRGEVPDCALARAGEPLLRAADGRICYRGFEACKEQAGAEWYQVQSTCMLDQSLPYCETDDPNAPVLRDDNGTVCRNTLNDFIWGGWGEFNQWKVTFVDGNNNRRCATVISEYVNDFDPLAFQESDGTLTSITGTMKQVQFQSGSSFWVIEVRDINDIVF